MLLERIFAAPHSQEAIDQDPDSYRQMLRRTLYRCAGDVSEVARTLGVSRAHAWRALKYVGLNAEIVEGYKRAGKSRFRLSSLP